MADARADAPDRAALSQETAAAAAEADLSASAGPRGAAAIAA